MTGFYDTLETRSADARAADQLQALNAQLAAYDMAPVDDLSGLARLPVFRKSEMVEKQAAHPPFGGLPVQNAAHVFQSPGPIYEPGGISHDWWRIGRFLHALGVGPDDIVQNCFAYHLTPAGMISNRARGPWGGGAARRDRADGIAGARREGRRHDRVCGHARLPEGDPRQGRGDGRTLRITRAAVGGGALFPSLRQEYADRGITCLQNYATADLGNVAYETPALEGMIVDEGVIVEIVRPGTGDPVPEGEVGEVVVTALNPDYPLIRFATGDLSAVLPGQSPCGRTNMRIKGWMGRADQTTKIKGMFVRPEQVADLVARHTEIGKARVIATREGEMDVMTVQIEAAGGDAAAFAASVAETLKLKGTVEIVAPGSLPNDGKVIDDQRSYD